MNDTTERYRLRRAVLGRSGGQRLEPVPEHPALFATWREAQAAARTAGGRRNSIVVQSVLVNADGVVVFPADGHAQRSRGMWRSRAWAARSIYADPPKPPPHPPAR